MRLLTKSLARGTLALILAAFAVMSTAGSATASEVHIVQPGESLSQIAKKYGTTVADLQDLNGLPDANYVRYGQRLLIDTGETVVPTQESAWETVAPAQESAWETEAPAQEGAWETVAPAQEGAWETVAPAQEGAWETVAPAQEGAEEYQLYTVQSGDTLFRLAGKHGISLTKLMSINGFSEEEWLKLGQELLVPSSLAPAPQPAHLISALQPSPPKTGMQPGRTRPDVHTVQAGELLTDVAELYGVNPGALARLNDLQNKSIPEPGQILRIPSVNGLELLEGKSQWFDTARYPTLTERWIEVDLNEQMAVAYEGVIPVRVFVISSGVDSSPTVTGTYSIWVKIAMQDMRGGSRAAGDSYHVTEVKNVQYFHEDYAFHGTYWHSNFGTPMSRGCINMTEEDAEWLFEWAAPTMYDDDDDGFMFSTDVNPGTLVLIHEGL